MKHLFAFGLCCFFVLTVHAHPGKLNTEGCHTVSSDGSYHCHNADGAKAGQSEPAVAEIEGRVVAVTDGDTIKVLDANNQNYKIRLVGIDAPERNQPFGTASKQRLLERVAGKQVRVESIKYDRYGRILAKVWVQPADCSRCGKTLNVNHAQILDGMAWWYRYYAAEQSEEDRGRYESAEEEARKRKWGLWADPEPVPPWQWRQR